MSKTSDVNAAYDTGKRHERATLIARLRELGVIRDAMFGMNTLVVYTEHGPKDITLGELTGENE